MVLLAGGLVAAMSCGGRQEPTDDPVAELDPAIVQPRVADAAVVDAAIDAGLPKRPLAEVTFESRAINGVAHVIAQPGDIDLGAASSHRVENTVDLCGGLPAVEASSDSRLPVVIVSVKSGDDSKWSLSIAVITLEDAPRLLAQPNVSSRDTKSGTGISAEWELVEPGAAGQPLRIRIYGRAITNRPGPFVEDFVGFFQESCAATEP